MGRAKEVWLTTSLWIHGNLPIGHKSDICSSYPGLLGSTLQAGGLIAQAEATLGGRRPRRFTGPKSTVKEWALPQLNLFIHDIHRAKIHDNGDP